MNVNICIVHYNSTDTIHCLESLASQTVKSNVILVNNASTDSSMERIRAYARSGELTVQIIDAPSNKGFAAGNNIALRWARTHTPKAWNLLLNNDTLVPPDFVEKLTQAAEEIRGTSATPFAMSAAEYDFSQLHKRHCGIQFISIPTGLSCSSPGLLRTPYLCGACILIDPDSPELDEDFFLYYEDADYSKQLQQAGYRLLTTDKTRYFHKMGGSTTQNPNLVSIQMQSMWRYYRKHYPHWTLFVKWFRKAENILRGRMEIVRTIDQTYIQAHENK